MLDELVSRSQHLLLCCHDSDGNVTLLLHPRHVLDELGLGAGAEVLGVVGHSEHSLN